MDDACVALSMMAGVYGVLRFLVLQHDASQDACCDNDFSLQNHGLVADILYPCLNINKKQKKSCHAWLSRQDCGTCTIYTTCLYHQKYIIYIHDYCAYQTKQTHICDVSCIFDISNALHAK